MNGNKTEAIANSNKSNSSNNICEYWRNHRNGFHGFCVHPSVEPGELCVLCNGKTECSKRVRPDGGVRSPSYDEMYNSLAKIMELAQEGLYELGVIRGANDLDAEDDLLKLAITVSKKILEKMPALYFESDKIEAADSQYGAALVKIEKAVAKRLKDEEYD